MLVFLVSILSFRFGEAIHPGPSFSFGSINPSGLLGKAELLNSLPEGCFGVCESHLSRLGTQQFRNELKAHQSHFRFLSTAPAPLIREAVGVIGGKCTGVGLLSSYPARNLSCDFPMNIQQEARVQATAVCIHGTWIKVGICYGYAHCHNSLATRQKTDDLLGLVVNKIALQCNGPRIIMGDFNQPYGVLPQEDVLKSCGFVELQQFGSLKWNRAPRPTCRSVTTKDFVWISPELIPLLEDIFMDDSLFPDHSVLGGTFRFGAPFEPVNIWRKPLPIPWDETQPSNENEAPIDEFGDTCHHLQNIFQHMEERVHKNLVQQGKPGLQPQHRGRCQTVSTQLCKKQIPPIKKGRKMDVQPGFQGENFKHVVWLKQLRRLQSLTRILSASNFSASHLDHGTQLWEVILTTRGFGGSFREWWQNRIVFLPGAPCTLPHALPDRKTVSLVFTTFEMEFRRFEKGLWNRRVGDASARRIKDPQKIFRDVAKPKSLPVQTLVNHQISVVQKVADDNLSCTVSSSTFAPQFPLQGPQGVLDTKQVDGDQLSFNAPSGLEPGDIITQKKLLGSKKEVFREFENLWQSFWGKHGDTPADRWSPFVEFCKEHCQSNEEMPLTPLTLERWQRAVKHRKKRSATGPDGVSRDDLINMTDIEGQSIVSLLNRIENGEAWPKEILIGLISSLEKKETSEVVGDYRPICVLSSIYRTWSSIRAKEILKFLSLRAPPELIGNRPKKEPGQIWWTLSSLVEDSFQGGTDFAGACADISKCFNNLPRTPIFALARLQGIPVKLCQAWHRALAGMIRMFQMEGAVGNPLTSTCGMPEGDPLSVCGMYLINLSLHSYLRVLRPNIRMWTFVDDWQLTGQDVDSVEQGFQSIGDFTQMLDLNLDEDKSYFWGTSGAIRSEFRLRARKVRLHVRNLGGHVSYCRMPTNFTITDRIRATSQLWTWLKRSRAPTWQKMNIVSVVGWPRCLHAIACVPLGDLHVASLRSKVMQSLGFDKKGANPLIQMSLITKVRHDPGFHILITTFRAFRKWCLPDIAFPILDALSQGATSLRAPGPCHVFLSRLHSVAWTWVGNGIVSDHEGFRHHIPHDAIQTLHLRLQESWYARVGAILSTREGFQGMEFVNPSLTCHKNSNLNPDDEGLLRVVLNGTFFTRDKIHATGKVLTKACPFCKEEDSILHRHFECPVFQDSRNKVSREVFADLQHLPDCTTQHGWICNPPELILFRQELMNLPDFTHDFSCASPIAILGILHIFVDGSCLCPNNPICRVATWGVTVANLVEDNFVQVARGPVRGLHQTSTRAELTACLAGYHFGLKHRNNFWIWTDNQVAFAFLKQCGEGFFDISTLDKDHDLKSSLWAAHQRAVQLGLEVKVVKVTSHMEQSEDSSLVDSWVIRGNDSADRCAEQARLDFSLQFWTLWDALFQRLQQLDKIRQELHTLFLDIGRKVVSQKASIRDREADAFEHVGTVQQTVQDDALISLRGISNNVNFGNKQGNGYRSFGHFAPDVWRWLVELVSSSEVVQWVSIHQLLIIFQLQTGFLGIKRKAKLRAYELLNAGGDSYDFLELGRHFGIYLKALTGFLKVTWKSFLRRPGGSSYNCQFRCFRIHLAADLIDQVDRIFVAKRVVPITGANSLANFGTVNELSP